MAGGRPLRWSKPEEIEPMIEAYFAECVAEGKPYTITGLAYAMDTSRETLMNYEGRGEFFDTIKKAKDKCSLYAEEQLFLGKNTAGIIFNMKNNYGWKDKQEIEHSGGIDKLTDEQVESKLAYLAGKAGIALIDDGEGEEAETE